MEIYRPAHLLRVFWFRRLSPSCNSGHRDHTFSSFQASPIPSLSAQFEPIYSTNSDWNDRRRRSYHFPDNTEEVGLNRTLLITGLSSMHDSKRRLYKSQGDTIDEGEIWSDGGPICDEEVMCLGYLEDATNSAPDLWYLANKASVSRSNETKRGIARLFVKTPPRLTMPKLGIKISQTSSTDAGGRSTSFEGQQETDAEISGGKQELPAGRHKASPGVVRLEAVTGQTVRLACHVLKWGLPRAQRVWMRNAQQIHEVSMSRSV
ncbi:unnamed protein product [Protopolystoma xenopodis]|uniref:Ig-like domain-containing protein n=1 Tax=Protopolystoma xenopodis TaxID=117903 RepID=A0A3S4ZSZ1_9PLAT|nr:unnamed protein product [Protopolystoma xenopodis]